jgi:hypothetical protein
MVTARLYDATPGLGLAAKSLLVTTVDS